MDRARARWLEEFADSRMGEIFIWRLFNQVAIKSAAWSEPTDPSVVENTLKNDIQADTRLSGDPGTCGGIHFRESVCR
jgi:hypothetical protein